MIISQPSKPKDKIENIEVVDVVDVINNPNLQNKEMIKNKNKHQFVDDPKDHIVEYIEKVGPTATKFCEEVLIPKMQKGEMTYDQMRALYG